MVRNEKTITKNITPGYVNVNRYSSDDLIGDQTLYKAQNVDLTKGIGKVQTCDGYGAGTNIAAGTLYGGHNYALSTGSNIPLAHIGTTMYRYVGSWAATTFTTLAAARSEFTTFLDYEFVTDGTQVKSSANGTTWGTTKLTSAPSTGIIDICSQKGRLYMLDKQTLYYSTVVDVSLNITWNTSANNLQINPYDGDFNTAVVPLRQRLLIFKNFSTLRFYQYTDTVVDLSPVSESVGTANTRSFVIDPDGTLCYLFGTQSNGTNGIYMTDGEQMTVISRPIQDILDGVSASNWPNICAGVSKNKIKFYLGDVTLKDGSVISKCEVQYSALDKTWMWRSLAHAPVLYQPYVVSSTRSNYFLDSTSNLYQDDTGSTFGGTQIHSEIESPWRRFDEAALLLTTRELTISGQNLQKIQTRVRTIDSERWVTATDTVARDYVQHTLPTVKGSRFKVNVTWSQPTIVAEADRVSIEKISLGFKDDTDAL